MTTVPIKDAYAEILGVFGDLQASIDDAVQRYTVDKITAKINELRQKDAAFQSRYGVDYSAFSGRIAVDESFVNEIESSGNKLWELDLVEWEFCHKGIDDWMTKLHDVRLSLIS